MNFGLSFRLPSGLLLTSILFTHAAADVVVGDLSVSCAEDSACMNRLHPDIPMVASAGPGERIVFVGRDAFDLTLDPDEFSVGDPNPRDGFGIVHALTGPVAARFGRIAVVGRCIETQDARAVRQHRGEQQDLHPVSGLYLGLSDSRRVRR